MSGSRNAPKAPPWTLSPRKIKALLKDLRRRVDRSAPQTVRDAVCRIDQSFMDDAEPDRGDLALVMLWLVESSKTVKRRRSKRTWKKKDRAKKPPLRTESAKAESGSRRGWSRTTTKTRGTEGSSDSQKKDEGLVETAFAQQIEKQGVGRVRRRLRVPRSRVKSDSKGRRVLIRGDRKG